MLLINKVSKKKKEDLRHEREKEARRTAGLKNLRRVSSSSLIFADGLCYRAGKFTVINRWAPKTWLH